MSEPVRTDFIDYPTAWAIQNDAQLEHHPDCSSVPGSNRGMGGPGLLCDCAAMPTEWARRAIAQEPEREAEIRVTLQDYLPEHMRAARTLLASVEENRGMPHGDLTAARPVDLPTAPARGPAPDA